MKTSSKFFLVLVFGFLFFNFLAQTALAIPPFARKYETSCQTCHIAYPKLNAFGKAFMNNGFIIPEGEEDLIKQEPISMGADAWKRVWPKAVWPGDIPRWFPLSMRSDFSFNYLPDSENEVKTDFQTPNEIELLAGGNLGRVFSYFTNLTLLEGNEFGGLHRIFMQLHPFGESTLFNIKIGGIEPRAVPFSGHRYLNLTNFLINEIGFSLHSIQDGEIGFGGHHGGSDFSLGLAQRGIELWGAKGFKHGGFEWAVGLVNGNGLGNGDNHVEENGHDEPGEGEDHGQELPHTADLESTLDNNSSKDLYWRLSYKLGGMSVTGEVPEGVLKDAENWKDNSVRIGLFGYYGKSPEDTLSGVEEFNRIGADIDIWLGNLNLFGGIWRGENEGPWIVEEEHEEENGHMEDDHEENGHDEELNGGITQAQFKSFSYFAQADYVIHPWLIGSFRWETFRMDSLAVLHENDFELVHDFEKNNITRLVPHITALIRANVKVVLEAVLYTSDFWKVRNKYTVNLNLSF
jgi:hypothetical protein